MLVETMLHNYIGGTWEAALATESIAVTNTASGAVIAQVPLSSREDVANAVKAAAGPANCQGSLPLETSRRSRYEDAGSWRRPAGLRRGA